MWLVLTRVVFCAIFLPLRFLRVVRIRLFFFLLPPTFEHLDSRQNFYCIFENITLERN